MVEAISGHTFGYAVPYDAPGTVHMVSGGEAIIDGCSPRSLGAVADGVSGGVITVCGERAYGVLGDLSANASGELCADCVEVFRVQCRAVVPVGWTEGERDAYWYGFDRGAQFCAFMHVHHADAFGDEVPMTPWHIEASDALKSRFDAGMLDGARAFGATLTRVSA